MNIKQPKEHFALHENIRFWSVIVGLGCKRKHFVDSRAAGVFLSKSSVCDALQLQELIYPETTQHLNITSALQLNLASWFNHHNVSG